MFQRNRNVSQQERYISSLDHDLPPTKEWNEFLMNQENKLQIVNLLVEYIKSGAVADEAVIVNQKCQCFFVNQTNNCVRIPELDSSHKKADQKIPMHIVYADQYSSNKVCVIADDTDTYLSLINIAHLVKSCFHFRQGNTIDNEGITYCDILVFANHLGKEICSVLPAFHTLTWSYFTHRFFNRSKIQAFKKMLRICNSHKLLLSLPSDKSNRREVTDFVLHVVCNRLLKEKTPGESRYNMLTKKKKQTNSGKKNYNTSMELPPDQCSLKMKILRASFVAHCMSHYLNPYYVPLDPSVHGWKLVENYWEPIWFEGYPLPHSVNLLNITEVSSEKGKETSENGLVSEPEESENKEDCFSNNSEYPSSASESDNIYNDF